MAPAEPVVKGIDELSAHLGFLPSGAAAEPLATESKKETKMRTMPEVVVMECEELPAEHSSQTDETVAEPPATDSKKANVLTVAYRYAMVWARRHPSHLVQTGAEAWLERGDG